MARYNLSVNKSWQNLGCRTILIIVSIILVVWFMPRGAHQQLQYDLNAPWKSELLMARHAFPVNKSSKAIEQEKDSMRRAFQPYYSFQREVGTEQVKALSKYLSSHQFNSDDAAILTERLGNIYSAGVLDTADYNMLMEETDKHIRLIAEDDTMSRRVSFTFTPTSASELLLNDRHLTHIKAAIDSLDIAQYIIPNLTLVNEASTHELDSLLASISPFSNDTIKEGQKIIDRGEVVDSEKALILQSYIEEMERLTSLEQRSTTLFGQLIFVVILFTLFTFYLYLFRKDYFYNTRSMVMLYALVTAFPVIVSLMMRNTILSVYLLPFAMLPIFVRVFMDSRTAFSAHVTMVLLCSLAVGYHYEFILIQIVAGLVAIYSLRELSSRSQILKSAVLVTAAAMLTYLSIQLIQTDKIDTLGGYMYRYLIVSGILLLLSYPLMYVFEKLFGFTSDVSLFEISDTNKGALRELSEVAPGTFQHSITVGNLAAEIARRIGANALLVRTGALYHDIGKMADPVYYTENQAGISPHDDIPYAESARIIISHVTEGVKIADRYRLPQFIKDFILTHHGTGLTKYFYIKQQNDHPGETVDPKPYTYPGPNPFTREQAILMMADGVEAASRSLTTYTEESISGLVNKMVDGMVQADFFANCPITFLDIKLSKEVLIERLKALYHTRISYPEANKSEEEQTESNN